MNKTEGPARKDKTRKRKGKRKWEKWRRKKKDKEGGT
jgi:hypothetical protein